MDSMDSRLRGHQARMDMLLRPRARARMGRVLPRVGIGVVVRLRLHRVVGSQVLGMDLEEDSILPRVVTDLLLLGHLAGAGIHKDTEELDEAMIKEVRCT